MLGEANQVREQAREDEIRFLYSSLERARERIQALENGLRDLLTMFEANTYSSELSDEERVAEGRIAALLSPPERGTRVCPFGRTCSAGRRCRDCPEPERGTEGR